MQMRIPWLFKRKTRWMRQVDAYVDGRLTPIERELLEERLEESADVRAMLDETRALKQSLQEMPEHRPRRSFAVTPGMLVEAAPAQPSRVPVVTMRLAQGATFAAMAALAITATVHISDTGDTSSDDLMAPMSGELAIGEDESDVGSEAPPEADGAEPFRTAEDSMGAEDNAEAAPQREADDRPSLAAESDSRNFMPVYGALGAILALASGAWLFSRRRVQNE